MILTQKQVALRALSSIGVSDAFYDVQPSILQSTCSWLSMMLASWYASGISLGLSAEGFVPSKLDESVHIPDRAVEAIVANLAVRVAPELGITAQPSLVALAERLYNSLLSSFCAPLEMRINHMAVPAGAGSRRSAYPYDGFLTRESFGVTAENGGVLELGDDDNK